MLYILTGSDAVKAKERARKIADGYEVVRIGEGGEPVERTQSYLNSRGLFSKKVALMIDRPLETEMGKTLFESLVDFQKSQTLVIIIAPELSAALKKQIPNDAQLESFEAERDEESSASVFAIADAFASGDRKKSWILYRKLIDEGVSAEEIHGILAWQARAMVLASKARSATDAGLKPFVYSKAKRAVSRLRDGEAESLSRELVTLYHDSRAGRGNLAELLEIFLLKRT